MNPAHRLTNIAQFQPTTVQLVRTGYGLAPELKKEYHKHKGSSDFRVLWGRIWRVLLGLWDGPPTRLSNPENLSFVLFDQILNVRIFASPGFDYGSGAH